MSHPPLAGGVQDSAPWVLSGATDWDPCLAGLGQG